ncbi:MAG: hypothetical protein QNL80_10930 [Akkermansiaceae bacterium]
MKNDEENAARKALEDARLFRESGDFEKALERHEWFHHHALSICPSLYGVRLSFALADWKRLGDEYSLALASMRATREQGLMELFERTASREIFHDVSSINSQLGEDDLTLALFKEIHEHDPALALKCFRIVQDILLEEKEVELLIEYAGSLRSHLQVKIEQHQELRGYLQSQDGSGMAPALKRFDETLINTALQLIEIAREGGNTELEVELREIALKVIEDPRLELAE